MQLTNDLMTAEFSDQSGLLTSLKLRGDELQTEYIGNRENTKYPSILERNQWMGDWRFRVWKQNHFQEELTSRSRELCRVSVQDEAVHVRYDGVAADAQGLRSLSLEQRFYWRDDALCWDVEIANRLADTIEVGEVSLAFLTNTDFEAILRDPSTADLPNWHGEKQRRFHEQCLHQHLCVDGGSSYALLQRPNGDWPALLFQPGPDTSLEAAYQMDKRIAGQFSVVFEGPYYLSLFANGALRAEEWKTMTEATRVPACGSRSLLMQPGECRRFSFRFTMLKHLEDMEAALFSQDEVIVEARPGMTAPVGQPIVFSLRCKKSVELTPNGNMKLERLKREGDHWYYRLTASQSGQKEIRVRHGERTTYLFFLFTEEPATLLKRRASFIAAFQFYDNPLDSYGRHHTFLPYDDMLHTLFLDSLETWQVSSTDELCLPSAMFLAEKNALYPNEGEIAILEAFVEDGLLGKLQNRDTLLAVRSLRWEDEIYPSDCYYGGKGTREWAQSTNRCFQYALITDFYFSMARIAERGLCHGCGEERYMELAYRTALLWFDHSVGDNKWNGGPAGATIIPFLQALKAKYPEWYAVLDGRVCSAAELNALAVYPYGSELMIDQTPHNQIHAMLSYAGYHDKALEVCRVTRALRDGLQPAWYQYGNDKRGNVCCWYATPMNSRVMYEAYDELGDARDLRLGYQGLASFLSTLGRDGAAHGWYLCWPDRSGFDTRSLDTDMGLYSYLMNARGYVCRDRDFGLVGYGCQPREEDGCLMVDIHDGVGRALSIEPLHITIRCEPAGMKRVQLNPLNRECIVTTDCDARVDARSVRIFGGDTWTLRVETENEQDHERRNDL